ARSLRWSLGLTFLVGLCSLRGLLRFGRSGGIRRNGIVSAFGLAGPQTTEFRFPQGDRQLPGGLAHGAQRLEELKEGGFCIRFASTDYSPHFTPLQLRLLGASSRRDAARLLRPVPRLAEAHLRGSPIRPHRRNPDSA